MRVRLTFIPLIVLLICHSAVAATCPKGTGFETCVDKLYKAVCPTSCDAKEWRAQWVALRAYCEATPASAECTEWAALRAGELSLNHRAEDWRSIGTIEERTKFDVNGKPEVALQHGDHMVIFVEGTNPLLFGVELQDATRDTLKQIDDLKDLAKSLAKIAGMGLKATSAVGESGDVLEELAKPLRTLDGAVAKVSCVTDRTSRQVRRIVGFLQAIETGAVATYDPTPSQCVTDGQACPPDCGEGMICKDSKCVDVYGPEYTNRVIGDLELAVETFDRCGAVAKLGTALTKIGSEEFAAARTTYERATALSDCSAFTKRENGAPSISDRNKRVLDNPPDVAAAESNVAAAEKKVTAAEKALAKARTKDKPKREQELTTAEEELTVAKEDLEARRQQLSSLMATGALLATTDSALAEAEELLTKTGALVNNVHQIVEFNTRVNEHALRGAPGSPVSSRDVATFIIVPKVPDSVAWDETEAHPFKVLKTSPFADQVKTARAASIETNYKLIPASSRGWDVGVSIVRTRVADPTFAAIAPEGETAKKITVKKETTRSGELAMFLHLGAGLVFPSVPRYFRTAGLEIGTAVSTDSPAFFAGLSVPLGRYLRIGWGYTVQRVTQLNGQKVGMEVADDDAIKTRKGFEGGHYVSLSISVGAVKLFTKD